MSDRLYKLTRHFDGERVRRVYGIKCDECPAHEHVKPNSYAGTLPPEVITRKLQRAGWLVKNRLMLCPACAERKAAKPTKTEPATETTEPVPMQNEKPTATVAKLVPDQPRAMSPTDRRRIFRLIDENWDEQKARYGGAFSDGAVAAALNVPRAWVEQVRSEAFGSQNKNEEAEKLVANLVNLKAECETKARKALDLASDFEEMANRVNAALKRAEKLA